MNTQATHERATTYAEAAPRPQQSDADFERLLAKPAFRPQDLMQGDQLDRIERIAARMAEGRMTVPEYLRGNAGDCMAIAMQAMLWNMDPFAVAQKTHIVSGRLGYEAQLVNAVVQNSGLVRGEPSYEYKGDGTALECRVSFTMRSGAVRWTEWLKISEVTTKNSPLWKTNPRQQLGYLQIKNWARAYTPGAILGVYTVDELQAIENEAPAYSAPPPPPAPPALPEYTAADFTKNLPAWRKLVESGKKTAPDLLATLSTKAAFSEQQKAQILRLKAPPPATEDYEPQTYAQLADAINACSERKAAELIVDAGEHLPEDQRADLVKVVERKFAN